MAKRVFDELVYGVAKQLGFTVCVKTEYHMRHSMNAKDLLGFGDFLAMDSQRTCLIQATSFANFSSRMKKIIAIPEARLWLENPTRLILVAGFGPPRDRIEWLDLSDFGGSNGRLESTD